MSHNEKAQEIKPSHNTEDKNCQGYHITHVSETWNINTSLENIINGCYTKLLRMVLNVYWKDKWSNKKLYNDMPKITNMIAIRRLTCPGHCIRQNEEAAYNLIFWEPKENENKDGSDLMSQQ